MTGTSVNTAMTRIQEGFRQGHETIGYPDVVILDARDSPLTLEELMTVIPRAKGTFGGIYF